MMMVTMAMLRCCAIGDGSIDHQLHRLPTFTEPYHPSGHLTTVIVLVVSINIIITVIIIVVTTDQQELRKLLNIMVFGTHLAGYLPKSTKSWSS